MTKKFLLTFIVAVFFLMPSSKSFAEWTNLFNGILEVDIRTVSANAANSDILFAASEKNLYQSLDKGASWKKIYGIRGDNAIQIIFSDPSDADAIYIGTRNGIYKSSDAGKHWKSKMESDFSENNSILSMTLNSENPNLIWVGTQKGLFVLDKKTETFKRVNNLPQAEVRAVLDSGYLKEILIYTNQGLYKSRDNGASWKRVSVELSGKNNEETSTLEQFNIEEILALPPVDNIVYVPDHSAYYVATEKGLFKSSQDAQDWGTVDSKSFPDKAVRAIAASKSTFYIGTDEGVYRWDASGNNFSDLNDGLTSKKIQDLYYDENGGFVLAATKKGLYKYSYPELTFQMSEHRESSHAKIQEILAIFKNEPSIGDVQKAAIEYAEVHPRKISEWRKAAARKALLPNVSVNRSVNTDQNIDLDRGGTADPDHFIQGPNENSYDWSVGVSWDLGDLIWNNDQTSIDTRSRLMVELRDDVLTEVTHLFYERRRLEVDLWLNPPKELPAMLEKQLKLEELTASLDALTGGYFSSHLKNTLSLNLS